MLTRGRDRLRGRPADAAGLPGEVQSALGWVVREATTNVLRHGDARRCAVRLRVTEGPVVLTVENDGVGAAGRLRRGARSAAGSGLAGLRERLAAVDGTLEAGPVGRAAVPADGRVPLPADARGPGPDPAGGRRRP